MAFTTLIQANELAARLTGTDTLVCDCRFDLADANAGRRAYGQGHILGAVHVDLDTVLSGEKTGANGRHPLPDREDFAAVMAGFGLSAASQVVAYDAAEGMFAARLWAMLRWLGHANVAVLDGGLAAWTAQGGALETTPPAPRPRGDLQSGRSMLPLVDYDAVRAASATGARPIVDARAADRFRGENETLDKVGGHIPGAVSRVFRRNLAEDGRWKPADTLRQEFTELLDGRDPKALIAQCGSGVTACHNLLAMEIAGLPGAALYPGSWSEWSSRPGSPIATGSE